MGDFIFYQFSRPAIAKGDFSDFLLRFGPDKLPKGKELAGMMNNLATFVQGYDHDIREVYAILEVRRFYSSLVAAWPYWLYFGNLETEGLMTVVLCCIGSIDSIAIKGQSQVQVACDTRELLAFVAKHLGPMNGLCERAGMSERAIFDRTKRVFEYFGLPFDEPPPR